MNWAQIESVFSFPVILPVTSLIKGNISERQHMRLQRLVDVEPFAGGPLVLRSFTQHAQALLQLAQYLLRDERLAGQQLSR